jgi:tetratricopeptide (TPR) repeat protein
MFSEAPPYEDVLRRMNREGLFEKIELTAFSEDETNEYLYQIFQRKDFTHQFVTSLLGLSGGNPAQLAKCVQLAIEDETIYKKDNIWFNTDEFDSDSMLQRMSGSDNLLVAMQSIEKLAPESLNCLRYAALMKDSIDYQVLAGITQKSKIQILKELCSLAQKKILIQNTDESFELAYSALRPMLVEVLPQDQQAAMHAELAAEIQKLPRLDEADKIYLLAYHYSRTDDVHTAIEYLLKAGEISAENFAFLEAKNFMSQALELIDANPGLKEKSETIQFLFWMAWVDRILGNWRKSIEHYTRCLELCDEDDAKLKAQILLQEGLTYFRLNDWPQAQSCIEQCLSHETILTTFDKAMAYGGLGNIHFELADYELSCYYYQKAIEIGSQIEAPSLIANLYNNLGAIENIRGQRMKAIALYSKSVPIFKNLSDGLGLARVYNNIGMTYADDRQWEQADEFYGQSLQVSDVMGLVPMKAITFLNRTAVLVNLGQYDEAREYNGKALNLITRLQDELGLAEYHKMQGIIELETGQLDRSEIELKLALQKFEKLENRLGIAETEYELGRLAQSRSDDNQARELFNSALQHYRDVGNTEKITVIEDALHRDGSTADEGTQYAHSSIS